jgi:hypothetical protein
MVVGVHTFIAKGDVDKDMVQFPYVCLGFRAKVIFEEVPKN